MSEKVVCGRCGKEISVGKIYRIHIWKFLDAFSIGLPKQTYSGIPEHGYLCEACWAFFPKEWKIGLSEEKEFSEPTAQAEKLPE